MAASIVTSTTPSAPGSELRGSCLCGAVQYRAALPVNHASHCYCTMCRKHHGAAAGSYVNVASAGFVIEQGAGQITEFASSAAARRGFCSVCGASLYWRSNASPENVALTLGTLEAPYAGPVERELFIEQKPGWLPAR